MACLLSKTSPSNQPLTCSLHLSKPRDRLRHCRHEGFSLFFDLLIYLERLNCVLIALQHPNPVGGGLAMEAVLESAGPECVVPGQVAPLRLLGVKVPLLRTT